MSAKCPNGFSYSRQIVALQTLSQRLVKNRLDYCRAVPLCVFLRVQS